MYGHSMKIWLSCFFTFNLYHKAELKMTFTDMTNNPVSILKMTPEEYRNGGAGLCINYCFARSPFGEILMASTARGICSVEFPDSPQDSVNALKARFPNARFCLERDSLQENALQVFDRVTPELDRRHGINLHIKGTDFQIKVWEALLHIPFGTLVTYKDIAAGIGHPKACRAVGSAIGANPAAFIIPCHRVIPASGNYGNYRWGPERKSAMISWEASWLSAL